jgi:protein-tyrosine phosphatase
MIDMHCHILPGIDDGAASVEVAVAMARELVAAGFEGVTATPHVVDKEGMRNRRDQIVAAAELLKQGLAAAGVSFAVHLGAEYHYDRPFPELLRKNFPLATLADSYYVLLEMPNVVWPEYLEYSIMPAPSDPPEVRRAIAFMRPVIAHPERNQEVMRNYRRLKPIREQGYLFQVNLDSLLGLAGPHVAKVTKSMAKEGMIDFLGTDGHNPDMLRQVLPDWRRRVEKIIGTAQAEIILDRNPGYVLNNESIDLED